MKKTKAACFPPFVEQLLHFFSRQITASLVCLNTEEGLIICKYEDIVGLKADGRDTRIYLNGNIEYRLPCQGIGNLESHFTKHSTFIRVHNSYIINTIYLQKYDRRGGYAYIRQKIKGRNAVPIGICYQEALEQLLESWRPDKSVPNTQSFFSFSQLKKILKLLRG